jgi:hypothetical protein
MTILLILLINSTFNRYSSSLVPAFPKLRQEITKYENVTLETENIRKLNNVSTYPLAISADGVFT